MHPIPPDTATVRARLASLLPVLSDRYGVRSIALFGSYARGEQTEASDIDLLVEFSKTPDLYAMGELVLDLEEWLALRVDLFTRSTLKPRMLRHVDEDLTPV
jgi:uncharacterized protein